MPKVKYQGSEGKQVYTNNAFNKGMFYTNSLLPEGVCQVIANLDISPTGSLAQPRNGIDSIALGGQLIDKHTIPFKSIQDQDNIYYLKFKDITNKENYLQDNIKNPNIVGFNIIHPNYFKLPPPGGVGYPIHSEIVLNENIRFEENTSYIFRLKSLVGVSIGLRMRNLDNNQVIWTTYLSAAQKVQNINITNLPSNYKCTLIGFLNQSQNLEFEELMLTKNIGVQTPVFVPYQYVQSGAQFMSRGYGNVTGELSTNWTEVDVSFIAAVEPSYVIPVQYDYTVDGDTANFIINGVTKRYRFLGINTPEMNMSPNPPDPYAVVAKNYTEKRLMNAREIRIEYDSSTDRTDKDQRDLVWVWVDKSLLNYELLFHGLANTFFTPGLKYMRQLKDALLKAKQFIKGIHLEGSSAPSGDYPPLPKIFNETITFDILKMNVPNTRIQNIEYVSNEIEYEYIDYQDAIAVLGKVYINSKELYRAPILFKVHHNATTDKFEIRAEMLHAHEPNVTEAINTGFNLLLKEPFSYRNYFGWEATESGYLTWDVVGVIPFNSDNNIITQASKGTAITYKAFVAAPSLAQSYMGYAIKWEYRFDSNENWVVAKDWDLVLNSSGSIIAGKDSAFELNDIKEEHGNRVIVRVSFSPVKEIVPKPQLVPHTLLAALDERMKQCFNYMHSYAVSEYIHKSGNEYSYKFLQINSIVIGLDNTGDKEFIIIFPRQLLGSDYVVHKYDFYVKTEIDERGSKVNTIAVRNISGFSFFTLKFKFANAFNAPSANPVEVTPLLMYDIPVIKRGFGYVAHTDNIPIWHVDPIKGFEIPEHQVTFGVLPAFNLVAPITNEIKGFSTFLDLSKATSLSYFFRQLLMYGPNIGDNILQFSQYEQLNYMPFDKNCITFPEPIIHVHPHKDTIIVFCKDNIYMLFGGYEPLEMNISKIYSNLSITEFEKNTVTSMGNDLFFMSNLKGYIIHQNKYSTSVNDISVIPITKEIDELLYDPSKYINMRLKRYYANQINLEANITTLCELRTSVYNNKLHLYASYSLSEINKQIMIVFIYDSVARRWLTHDNIHCSFPISINVFESYLGQQMLCANHPSFVKATTLNMNFFKRTTQDKQIFEINNNGVFNLINSKEVPVQIILMSGNILLDPHNQKRFSQLFFTVNNIDGRKLPAKIDFKVDGEYRQNSRTVQIVHTQEGYYEQIESNIDNINIPGVTILDEWELDFSRFPEIENLRVEFGVSGKGKAPSFILSIDSCGLFELVNYGIIYKKKSI